MGLVSTFVLFASIQLIFQYHIELLKSVGRKDDRHKSATERKNTSTIN